MNKRLIKEECYLDMLEDEINSVDAVLNYIDKLKEKKVFLMMKLFKKISFIPILI
ncbi:hypothetical protein SD457_03390 [Coprobacillaceae bacterium CR2/5/TPMF4]|nr:hypothetical protein SD457_03390 [Coprobacillaceae bacterium CR2/5/TPMF4]